MKKKILILISLIACKTIVLSQNIEGWGSDTSKHKDVSLEADENYVVFFRFDSIAMTNQCPCFIPRKVAKKCVLVKGKMINVSHIPDFTSNFLSRIELMQMSYVLVPKGKLNIKIGDTLFMSTGQSANNQYLVFCRTRNPKESNRYYYKGGVIQSFGPCSDEDRPKSGGRKDRFAEFIGRSR